MKQGSQGVSLQSVRCVWAELTKTPCASVRAIGARVGRSPVAVWAAARQLRDAGYIAFEDRAPHARTVIVPFYVIEGK